ncbi:cutinase family protein [Antrihabitans cavernicola]|uniref:Cutinase family protein n=1 Tax=Antrihabitans cavernicola TaxID=2495913 RepID=A0A5A7SJ44_9NOCA|nr:cutinase family protein [Spelaeibacter cavernicola]KAA0024643.1 cutinase family protein [Spelaeibacter cavernicola]
MARKKRSFGKLLALFVALVVVFLLVIALIWYLAAGRLNEPTPVPGPTPGPGQPQSQPASCPDVQVVAIPGTWESSSADDPHNPTFNPKSLIANVTRPLQQQFPASRADVYTIPYVAQFSNPVALPPDGQASYNVSRSEGAKRANDVVAGMHANCPLTNFVIVGFSQGAVIAGDLAAQIGADKGPAPANQVLGVTLIADGRRDSDAKPIGPDPDGVGAEVALKGVNLPGITMTGPRGGFGALGDRVNSICAPGDLICTAPKSAMNPLNIPGSLAALAGAYGNPVHSLYNSFAVEQDGTTATQWTERWAADLIDKAPTPAHS